MWQSDRAVFPGGVRHPLLNSCKKLATHSTASDSGSQPKSPQWPSQYRYFHETDTLSVYFVKAVPGLINNTEDAVPGLLVDYIEEQKIVSFDIRLASVRTRAHFWDTVTNVQGAPPLCLHTKYSQEADTFTVSFVDSPQHCRSICTDDDRISIWVDASEKWESVVFASGRESIAS